MMVSPVIQPLRHGCLAFNSAKPPSYSIFVICHGHAVVTFLLSVGILPGHYNRLRLKNCFFPIEY